MSGTITIAPVRKSVRVSTTPEHAFEVFTARLGKWWPKDHGIGKNPNVDSAIEPRVGGHWYEVDAEGSRTKVGTILEWEPPRRFVMSWDITTNWEPSDTIASEIEVIFTADGDHTIVDLEHRNFEALGEGGEKMRDGVNGGWPGLLDMYKAEAERR